MSLSGALSEATELYEILAQINGQLGLLEKNFGATTAEDARVEADRAFITMSQLLMTMRRLTRVFREMGLGDSADQVLNTMSHMIYVTSMLYRSLTLIETGTPYGLIMGALGLFSAAEQTQGDLDRMVPSAH